MQKGLEGNLEGKMVTTMEEEKGKNRDVRWNPLREVPPEVARLLDDPNTLSKVLEAIFCGTFDENEEGGVVVPTQIAYGLANAGWDDGASVILGNWIAKKRVEFLRHYGVRVPQDKDGYEDFKQIDK